VAAAGLALLRPVGGAQAPHTAGIALELDRVARGAYRVVEQSSQRYHCFGKVTNLARRCRFDRGHRRAGVVQTEELRHRLDRRAGEILTVVREEVVEGRDGERPVRLGLRPGPFVVLGAARAAAGKGENRREEQKPLHGVGYTGVFPQRGS
jgi:hypothetical protein